MKFKKSDYIVFYLISLMFFAWNVIAPSKPQVFILCLIISIIASLVLGTLTNLVRLILKNSNS